MTHDPNHLTKPVLPAEATQQAEAAIHPLPTSETITEAFKKQLRHELKRTTLRVLADPKKNVYDELTQTVIDLLMDFEPTKPAHIREVRAE